MSRKKKAKEIVENVLVEDMAAEGRCVCHIESGVLFVTGAVPGDVVNVRIDKKRSNYSEGTIVSYNSYSSMRIAPTCPHFGVCGGCVWQTIPYEKQTEYKEREVLNNLRRIGHLTLPEPTPILPSLDTVRYRNKLEYTFSAYGYLTAEQLADKTIEKKPALGFHVPGLFDKVVDVRTCTLQAEISDSIRNWIRQYAMENGLTFYDLRQRTGFLRNLTVRISTTGDIMVIVAFAEERQEEMRALLDTLHGKFPEVTSLLYVVNTKMNDTIGDLDVKCHSGAEYITERMGDIQFRVGPKSFYQTNSRQAQRLYDVVAKYAALTGSETVYDLYTGTGTIANYIAKKAKKVVGIEYVPEAIEDAKVKSEINGIKNTEFFAGDMKDILTVDFVKEHGLPDVMVVDPPRAGMHPDVVATILEVSPKKIVYVSCNSATQARDISMMSEAYQVEALQPVDMFPHTHHVESVVYLTHREGRGESQSE